MDEDLLLDLFSTLPAVRIKRMFGGQGIFSDDLMVAIVISGEIQMKVDEETRSAFEQAGCTQWAYLRKGRPVPMSFYSLPEEALDDMDEMALWAERAFQAAKRTAEKAPRKQRAKRKSARAEVIG
ncbi:TfoX/Sxy family protein [Consotaella salsifontis]|uniref:DNA transformation protein n=1 Tax=Consotaella salsifontis TaxID=1365950 RepID=A0A1T4LRV0_9HYPH|nr:TfoX/Sxy family protein [Consotaella salsifontis]SJZ57450.1 DNA transformation protein [Consotaella salsifontis]